MKTRIPLIILTIGAFIITSIGPMPVQAQEMYGSTGSPLRLPAPGVRVGLSPPFNPPILKGIKVHTDNPFRFDFILDTGDVGAGSKPAQMRDGYDKGGQLNSTVPISLKDESTKLIKYFLASLTTPEADLWVNLSPYEKNRIIPQSFGKTEMGRDLLAQDYLLKQITASLIYPEEQIGQKFWKKVYEQAAKQYGTMNISVNTFNKVWIVPEKAVVYENAKAGTAYVVESRLKVMLEEDYLALNKRGQNKGGQLNSTVPISSVNALGSQIVREVVIPELTKEVNQGANFAQLRQVYNSLILATWYKKKIKDSILSQVYLDKNKIAGVNIADPNEKDKIYQQYLKAFKKGVYNYIKEEQDPVTQETIPRKYFSGGVKFGDVAMVTTSDAAQLPAHLDQAMRITTDLYPTSPIQIVVPHQAMRAKLKPTMALEKREEELKGFLEKHGKEITEGVELLDPYKRNSYGSNYESFTRIQDYGHLTSSGERVIQTELNQYGLVMLNTSIHPNTIITSRGYLTCTGIAVRAEDNITKRIDIGLAHILNEDQEGKLLQLLLETQRDLVQHGYTVMEYVVSYYPPMFKKDMGRKSNHEYETEISILFQNLYPSAKIRFQDRGSLETGATDTRITVDDRQVSIKPFIFKGRSFKWVKGRGRTAIRKGASMFNAVVGVPGSEKADRAMKTTGTVAQLSPSAQGPADRAMRAGDSINSTKKVSHIDLEGGASVVTSLDKEVFNGASKTPFGFRVVAGDLGIKVAEYKKWNVNGTPLDHLDRNYGIIGHIEKLDKQRTDPRQAIVILDYGCGDGTGLIQLAAALNERKIKNVTLYGYSDQYETKWNDAPKGITFILDMADNIFKHLSQGQVSFIYSHWGQFHVDMQFEKKKQETERRDYIRRLVGLLVPEGVMRSEVQDLADEPNDVFEAKVITPAFKPFYREWRRRAAFEPTAVSTGKAGDSAQLAKPADPAMKVDSSNEKVNRRQFLRKSVAIVGGLLAQKTGVFALQTPPAVKTRWIHTEQKSTLNLIVESSDTIRGVFQEVANQSHFNFRINDEQMKRLVERFKKENPSFSGQFIPGQEFDGTGIYNELQLIDILNRSNIVTTSRINLDGTNVTMYFVNSKGEALSPGAETIDMSDGEQIIIFDIKSFNKDVARVRKSVNNPETMRDKFRAEIYHGWGAEKIFTAQLLEVIAHELTHAKTDRKIMRGNFDKALENNIVVRGELNKRHVSGVYKYRIKQELAGILAQLSFTQKPKDFLNFLGGVSVGGGGNDDPAYESSAGIIMELIANDFNFGEYYFNYAVAEMEKNKGGRLNEEELKDLRTKLPKTYREFKRERIPPQMFDHFINFPKTLNDDDVRKAAAKWYQELFGELPSADLIKIPAEVIEQHRKEYSDSGADNASISQKGGIDFTANKTPLEIKKDSSSRQGGTQNDTEGIKFNLDPAMLQQLQNAPGFVPVIINITPMKNLQEFLGLSQAVNSTG